MAEWPVDAIRSVSEGVWTEKHRYDALLAECFEFALPDRNPYHGTGTGTPSAASRRASSDKSSRRVFDSTLQTDAVKIANRIQYELFPIGSQWASLKPGPFVPEEQAGNAGRDLYALQELIFAAIGFSNFDLAIAEWLLDLVVAGTAAMMVSSGDEDHPVVFQAVSHAHVAFREGAFGMIDFVSRKHMMRRSLIEQTWTDAKVPPDTGRSDGKANDPEVNVLDVCYLDAREKVWRYVVLIEGDDAKRGANEVVLRREYERSPWIISRWLKAPGETQGRSLVMQALPDARVLSAVKSYILRQAALAIGGVFLARNDGVLNPNNVRVFPGAVIPVRTTGGPAGASLTTLDVRSDTNLAQLVIQDLVTSIHKVMLNDGMPDIADAVRTATELVQRMKELQQSVGAPFARILKEGIVPMLEAIVDVLAKAGVINTNGRRIKFNSGEIEVAFASPLVQGEGVREVETLRTAAAMTAEIGGPEAVAGSFKVEEVGAWIASRLGVAPGMVRTPQERDALQKAAAQAAANQNGVPPVGGGGAGVVPGGGDQQQAAPLAA